MECIQKWGESFWQDTDYRITEITKSAENSLVEGASAELKAKIGEIGEGGFALKSEKIKKLTESEKAEVKKRGQEVVSTIQIQKLDDVIRLLNENVLIDGQKVWYITIDDLDGDWIDSDLRYFLIQALLEAIRDINNQIDNVKIVIALRDDLIIRTFRKIKNPGFQSDKYKSMHLEIQWQQDDLSKLINKRISLLVKKTSVESEITLEKLLPDSSNKTNYINYFFERTLMRPRDVILFFNECMKYSYDKSKISKDGLTRAEVQYSEDRLVALSNEWASDYPQIADFINILEEFPGLFKLHEKRFKIDGGLLEILGKPDLGDILRKEIDEKLARNETTLCESYIAALFKVGAIGIKRYSNQEVFWSQDGRMMGESEVDDQATIYIHKAFWKVLGIHGK